MRQVIRNRVLYELREREGIRWWEVLKWFLGDFPWRLARGLVGTPSSQPPGVTLKAYADLASMSGRLASQKWDEQAWTQYLEELGWKEEVKEGTQLTTLRTR